MKTYKEFVQESSLSRVHSHTQGRNIGMITAHRGENTAEENNRNNDTLKKSIRDAGYGFIPVRGRYVENHGTPQARHVDEKSFLVVGKKGDDKGELKKFLIKHGEKHGQDSILHKPHDKEEAILHGTKEGAFPGKGKTHNLGNFHPNRASEFHTAMKGSRTFAFASESFDFLNSVGFFSRKERLF